jgi:hypothetical protein
MKAIALVLAVLVVPFAAEAATKQHSRHHVSKPRGAYASQPQIACTQVGCLPVPRGCYPQGGKTFDGGPSGFDVMVCPGGDMYGHR